MWESNWVKVAVVTVFIVMAIAIAALVNDDFGAALHDFGFNVLGPAVMGGLTTFVCGPLAWGSITLLYGTVVWIAIGVSWVAIYWVAYKVAWQKYLSKPKAGPQAPIMTEPRTVVLQEKPASTTAAPPVPEKKTEEVVAT
jgi:hypothetical protein